MIGHSFEVPEVILMAYRIGDVSRSLGVSIDALRYYERIGLLPSVARTSGGTRLYGEMQGLDAGTPSHGG